MSSYRSWCIIEDNQFITIWRAGIDRKFATSILKIKNWFYINRFGVGVWEWLLISFMTFQTCWLSSRRLGSAGLGDNMVASPFTARYDVVFSLISYSGQPLWLELFTFGSQQRSPITYRSGSPKMSDRWWLHDSQLIMRPPCFATSHPGQPPVM